MSFWDRRKSLAAGVVFFLVGWNLESGQCVQAAEVQKEVEEEILSDLDFAEIQRAAEEWIQEDVSFTELFYSLLNGEGTGTEIWSKLVPQTLGIQRQTILHILLLVLMAAVCSMMSEVFHDQKIGEMAFYMVYLFLFVVFLKTFDTFSGELEENLSGLLAFMQALLPSYYLALTAALGTSTAGVFYQMILWLIYLAEHIILRFLLSFVRMYLLLELTNYLTKEEMLSRMTELLKNGILWVMKSMIGVVLGVQLIQRLIAPAMDALKRTAIGRTAGAIPGVGNLFNGVTELVVGSAVLIKNCLGAAAVLILLLATIPPMIRLGMQAVLYRFLAALVQPVADSRMVGCIHTMGVCIGILLKMLLTVDVLFLATIVILAGSLG